MYKITAEADLPFVEEFRKNPIGHHSPNLQRILNILRYDLSGNQIILVTRVPFKEWVLGHMPPSRDDKIIVEDDAEIFTTKEDAEWAVFCARWAAATGNLITTPRTKSVLEET